MGSDCALVKMRLDIHGPPGMLDLLQGSEVLRMARLVLNAEPSSP